MLQIMTRRFTLYAYESAEVAGRETGCLWWRARADSSVTATRSGRGAAASQLSAANRRRGTASDGILSGEWYDTAAAGQLPVCTGTKPDTA